MSENRGAVFFDRLRSNCKKHKKIIIAGIIAIVMIAGVLVFELCGKADTLVGTWVYDQYTQYVFERDGNGYLKVDDVWYDYRYTIAGDKLTMDFTEDVVRDCEYKFSVNKDELTLVGGENTDGGTYTLKKKDSLSD